MDSCEPMADALRADIERAPDAFRTDRFAGMGRKTKSRFARFGV